MQRIPAHSSSLGGTASVVEIHYIQHALLKHVDCAGTGIPEMPDGTLRVALDRSISAGARCGSGMRCSVSGARLYGGVSTSAAASVLPVTRACHSSCSILKERLHSTRALGQQT